MSISAANASIYLTVANLFPVSTRIQGFAADDVFDTSDVEPNEVLMGVDGRLSGGRVNYPVKWVIHLMADSPSIPFFDQWNQSEAAIQDTYNASGVILLNTIQTQWVMTNGFLTRFKPLPDAKKLLLARAFEITWESVVPLPT